MNHDPSMIPVDMDAFYAFVEQPDHPELRGRSVIVGIDRLTNSPSVSGRAGTSEANEKATGDNVSEEELRSQVCQIAALNSAPGQDAKMLLKQGQWFRNRAHSDAYEETKLFRNKQRPRPKECFYNAQLYVLHHDGARYFEGYAICSTLAVHHAWVVMPDGKVIDFTWEAAHREKTADLMPDCIYLGIEKTWGEIVEACARSGESKPFLAG